PGRRPGACCASSSLPCCKRSCPSRPSLACETAWRLCTVICESLREKNACTNPWSRYVSAYGVEPWAAIQIQGPTTCDLRQFALASSLDIGSGGAGCPSNVLIDHDLWVLAVHHRAKRQLGVSGNADFADHQQVEGSIQRPPYFKADGHAPTGKSKDDGVHKIHVAQPSRQQPAGFGSVTKTLQLDAHEPLPHQGRQATGQRCSFPRDHEDRPLKLIDIKMVSGSAWSRTVA